MPTDADRIRRDLRITCEDALSLMTHHLENALSARDGGRLRAHLAGCEACAIYLDQLRSTVRVTGSLGTRDDYEVDGPTMDRLLAMYRNSQRP